MPLDATTLKTETFTNSQGWTAVRVTHLPSTLLAERSRSPELDSPVEAQRQCIEELKETLAAAGIDLSEDAPSKPVDDEGRPVSRDEFNALHERVARLEREIGFDVEN